MILRCFVIIISSSTKQEILLVWKNKFLLLLQSHHHFCKWIASGSAGTPGGGIWARCSRRLIGASRAPGSKKKEGEQRTTSSSSRSIETPPPVTSLGNRASIHGQMRNHCTPTKLLPAR
mmetsp:Transcript_9833/g.29231  ORF Transcript_9833/g.29231 Transcript_9833/m.29231 type:complete len:119 (+) Transcript_9833:87-443(+)